MSSSVFCSDVRFLQKKRHAIIFLKFHSIEKKTAGSVIQIGIGHGCSDLSHERMLRPEEWKELSRRNLQSDKVYELHFFGVKSDSVLASSIRKEIESLALNVTFIDHCGEYSLNESVRKIATMDIFWAIDSSLLHYARLMGVKTIGIFGPTAPISLLKPLPYLEEQILYEQIPCSPCVHVTETPPCGGNNVCIQKLFT